MTNKEYELMLENEKLKKENQALKIKNKDLEAEKKTLKSKLQIQSEVFEDSLKENKTIYYKTKYELSQEEIKKTKKAIAREGRLHCTNKRRISKR